MAKQKIALLRLGALGDVCLITPLVHEIVSHFPDADFDWIIDKANEPLVRGLPGCRLLPIKKPRSFHDYWALYRQFRASRYDVLLVAQANFRVNWLSRCIRAKKRYGFSALHSRDAHFLFVNQHVPSYPEHLTDAFMRFAQALGVSNPKVRWTLPSDCAADAWVKEHFESHRLTLAICLNASKAERDWPLENWVKLLQHIHQHYDAHVVAIGGHTQREGGTAERLTQQCPFVESLVAKTSIVQLKAFIERADVLISPDTAPVHLAVAVNTPVIGLYAVAPMTKTGPYRSAKWSVDCYDMAVERFLNKDPKTVSWRQRVHHPEAMSLVTVDAVEKKCRALFSNLGFLPRTKAP